MSKDDQGDKGDSPRRGKNGRWLPGYSGNVYGRPAKEERAVMSLQTKRDILSITEGERTVRTSNGVIKMPSIVAILRAAEQKALSGNGPAQRHLIKMHREAVRENEADYSALVRRLECIEKEYKEIKKGLNSKSNVKFINKLRKETKDFD